MWLSSIILASIFAETGVVVTNLWSCPGDTWFIVQRLLCWLGSRLLTAYNLCTRKTLYTGIWNHKDAPRISWNSSTNRIFRVFAGFCDFPVYIHQVLAVISSSILFSRYEASGIQHGPVLSWLGCIFSPFVELSGWYRGSHQKCRSLRAAALKIKFIGCNCRKVKVSFPGWWARKWCL